MKDTLFMRLLKSRRCSQCGLKMSVVRLSQLSGVNRAHLTNILAGRKTGTFMRWRLYPYLTIDEIKALGWEAGFEEARAWAEQFFKFHAEQSENHTQTL